MFSGHNPLATGRAMIDIYGDFARLYGMRAEFLCLIRPDDHIGLFQSPIDEDAIGDYIARIAATAK
jgi:hypothetical protein